MRGPCLAVVCGVLAAAVPAGANHIAREDPPEPIFTERAFIENDVEFDVGVDRDVDGDAWELGPSVTWIFFERLQLGAEIPVGWNVPDEGPELERLAEAGGSLKDRVEMLEARVLRETLVRHGWNKSRAAEELGLSRVGLRAKLERYGLEPARN